MRGSLCFKNVDLAEMSDKPITVGQWATTKSNASLNNTVDGTTSANFTSDSVRGSTISRGQRGLTNGSQMATPTSTLNRSRAPSVVTSISSLVNCVKNKRHIQKFHGEQIRIRLLRTFAKQNRLYLSYKGIDYELKNEKKNLFKCQIGKTSRKIGT